MLVLTVFQKVDFKLFNCYKKDREEMEMKDLDSQVLVANHELDARDRTIK